MSVIDQKEYLKKYLGIGKGSGDKKKKKKSKKIISNGLKIVDDDVNISLSREIQEDLEADNEDTPQIVSVIDDRPPSLRVDEVTRNHLWQPIGAPEISSNSAKNLTFEGNIKLSKKLHDSKHIGIINSKHSRNKSDKQARNKIQAGSHNDGDFSPPRRRKNSDSDSSPPRHKKPKDYSLCNSSLKQYKTSTNSLSLQKSRNRGDDESSSRKSGRRNDDYSPPRRNKRKINSSPSDRYNHQKNEDSSPPRKARRNDNDNSPPRKIKRMNSEDNSPSRIKLEKNEDSSPPRRSRKIDDDNSPPRKNRHNIDSSPPRKSKREKTVQTSPSRKARKDNNYSLPTRITTEKNNDYSPSRKMKDVFSQLRKKSRWGDKEEQSDKLKTTLDGKKAGLQSASDLVHETAQLKKKEDELFNNMSAEVSGANAATVVRGKKKEIDYEEEERKMKKEEENKEKYDKWGKGLKQVEDRNERIKNELYEMSKPLARYADDEDLEKYLKDQEREGDPMLAYIRQKKKKKSVEEGKPATQQYQGDAPPNRFGIRPGYRWDGVDRSNGYEKQWFQIQNSRKASMEESYKWSTEDM